MSDSNPLINLYNKLVGDQYKKDVEGKPNDDTPNQSRSSDCKDCDYVFDCYSCEKCKYSKECVLLKNSEYCYQCHNSNGLNKCYGLSQIDTEKDKIINDNIVIRNYNFISEFTELAIK